MSHKIVLVLLGFSCSAFAILTSGNTSNTGNNSRGDLQPSASSRDGITRTVGVGVGGYQHSKELQNRPYEYVKADKFEIYNHKQQNENRERIKSKYKGNKDNVASASSYYDRGYPYGNSEEPGYPYHDSGQVYGDKDIPEFYNYHHGPSSSSYYHGPPIHYTQDHPASALKGLLLPLAGVALLGAAAALVSNPVLLQLGVVSGKRKRRSVRDIFAADQKSEEYETQIDGLRKSVRKYGKN